MAREALRFAKTVVCCSCQFLLSVSVVCMDPFFPLFLARKYRAVQCLCSLARIRLPTPVVRSCVLLLSAPRVRIVRSYCSNCPLLPDRVRSPCAVRPVHGWSATSALGSRSSPPFVLWLSTGRLRLPRLPVGRASGLACLWLLGSIRYRQGGECSAVPSVSSFPFPWRLLTGSARTTIRSAWFLVLF